MKTFWLVLTCFLLPLVGFSAFEDNFLNKTLRIDYIRSGNNLEENISLDELIMEPTWDRSKTMLIDPFNYGNYKFQAFDSASGELLFERHYSTLFNEWQTTAEAKTCSKSFQETMVMPLPKKTIRIVFLTRNRKNSFDQRFQMYVNPASVFISKEIKFVKKTTRIWFSGDPTVKLDIVIVAEGYKSREIQKFRRDAQRFANYLLECEPFLTMKDRINIWAVQASSEESGADLPGQGIWKKTILNSTFYTFGSERYLTTFDHKTLRHLASNAPYDQIVVLVNTDKYGGGGFYNFVSVTSSNNDLSNYVFVHEFGHALCGLGDEYYTSDVAMVDFYPLDQEPWEPNLTTLVDFDRKWKNMVDKYVPVPTPPEEKYRDKVGLFEGGGYAAKGVYRPTLDCTMKSTKYNYFCPVCQKALMEMIDFYTR